MKIAFNFNMSCSRRVSLGALLFFWHASSAHAGPPSEEGHAGVSERLSAVAAYVAADYSGAVRNGQVLVQREYDEQRGLLKEARALWGELRPLDGPQAAKVALDTELSKLTSDVEARVDEKTVVGDARAIQLRLVNDFGLVLAPSSPP